MERNDEIKTTGYEASGEKDETLQANVSQPDEEYSEDVEKGIENEDMTDFADDENNISMSDMADGIIAYTEMVNKTSRFTPVLAKASKKKKKDLYKSERVITEYGDTEIDTEATRREEDYLELVASARENRILTGIITGMRIAGDADNPAAPVLAEISYGNESFMIYIPSLVLANYKADRYTTMQERLQIERDITRRIGSKVSFVVQHVDEAKGIAYADRLAALSMIGVKNYLIPDRTGIPRIVAGLIVKAKVMLVTRSFIIVDALGAETRIPIDEMSWLHLGDCREEVSVGDEINVKIKNIRKVEVQKGHNKYTLLEVAASVKEATKNPKIEGFARYNEGGCYYAEITHVDDSGVFCRLGGKMDCLCAFPKFGKMPVRGEKRIVKVTQKNKEKLFVYGVFVNN